MMSAHAILIAGATASGKSAVALRLAEALDGVVINADSMQLYSDLRLLTARPGPADEARVPHRLYGIWPASERGSVGRWLGLAKAEAEAAVDQGRTPIFVGGTGLYFQALCAGLAPVPEIADDHRAAVLALHARIGSQALHQLLGQRDPAMAARLRPSDSQRLIRAYEVVEATGRSLLEWQEDAPVAAGLGLTWQGFVLDLPRDLLYRRLETRLDRMMAAGALEEVRALARQRLDPALPAMKALGIPDLIRHIDGELSYDAALAAVKQATRRYAKRQLTWFRNKMHAWNWQDTQDLECFYRKILSEIS